jgi:glycosyltransferase involved in cell wall biosynthesis
MMILADTWYADHIPAATRLDDRIPEWFRSLAGRSGVARGLAIVVIGWHADAVVITNTSPGATICKIAYGLLARRTLILLEYIVHEPADRDYVRRVWFRIMKGWLLRRALLRAQVLTEVEALTLPAIHHLAADHFVVVHWPALFDDSPVHELNDTRRVLASGRRTDWKTFFAAAEGTDWEVRAVCTAADLEHVHRLAGANAVIRHDISADEHQSEVERATVYVIPVPETGSSIGQIRVMNANQAGVPIVVSDVTGLRGYVDESSAVLVPPGDPDALRIAVDELLDDPFRRKVLRDAARRRDSTMGDYLDQINSLVLATVDVQYEVRP